ncbi:MAG: metallophosphoesterase [Capsulimonadaceae bacterium]
MIYAIGDVHGEAEALREMLSTLPIVDGDLVIFLGDLINRRGSDPFDCVEQVIRFDRCRKLCIMGNHEEAMVDLLETGALSTMEGMDCQSTLDSYAAAGYSIVPGDPASIPESHARVYYQTEPWTVPFYATETHIFTHAGWDLSRPMRQQVAHRLRWGKVMGFEAPVTDQVVVRGHTPMPKVTFSRAKRYIGVDTGCGLGGFLSAVALPGEAIFSVKPASYRPRWFQGLRQY